MFGEYKYRGYLVRPDVLESKRDRRIKWYGIVTIVHDRGEYNFSFEDRLFDWPAEARRYVVQRSRGLIDALHAGNLSPLIASSSIPRSRPPPDYPPGAFDVDTITPRF